jgi:hypothetical protein
VNFVSKSEDFVAKSVEFVAKSIDFAAQMLDFVDKYTGSFGRIFMLPNATPFCGRKEDSFDGIVSRLASASLDWWLTLWPFRFFSR